MTLNEAKIGNTYFVDSIDLAEQTKRRLEILGMTEKSRITLINKNRGGALIIKIRGTRFALGKEFAKGIYIKEGEEK